METWIYLIKDRRTGCYKIGKSNDPAQRLKQLCHQSTKLPYPHEFELVEAWRSEQEREKELHDLFTTNRVRGEWFQLDADQVDDIADMFFDSVRWSDGRTKDCDYIASYNAYLLGMTPEQWASSLDSWETI